MNKYIVYLAILTCSMGVAVSGVNTIHLAFLITGGFVSFGLLIFNPPDRKLLNMLVFYLSPFLLSLFVSLPINYLFNSKFHYDELEISGRIVMLLVCSANILYIHCLVKNNSSNFTKVIYLYYFSCFIMLLSALWQVLYLYTPFPTPFPFDTRSYIHNAETTMTFTSRITGLAQEPSYLAPFLNEFIICSFFLIKNKFIKYVLITTGLIVLFLTLSPSAYTSFLILLMVFVILKLKKIYFIFLIPLILIISSLIFNNIETLDTIKYYQDRMTGASDSGRLVVIFDALRLFFNDTDFFRLLFGNGFRTFPIMGSAPEINYYTSSSNNLFVDILFECGIVGVLLLLYLLYFLFTRTWGVKSNNIKIFSLLLFVNLLIASLFRADFATLRFFLTIYIIYYMPKSCMSSNTNSR